MKRMTRCTITALIICSFPTLLSCASEANAPIYVYSHTTNSFVTEILHELISQFEQSYGLDVETIITPSMDDALLRAVAWENPIDVVLIPFALLERYDRNGWITELSSVLDITPEAVRSLKVAERWMWGSVDGEVRCGYVPGSMRENNPQEPSYACLWAHSKNKANAGRLIQYLVEHAPSQDHWQIVIRTYGRKLLIERDYGSIYDHLLHPDRKSIVSRDAFIDQMQARHPCGHHETSDLRLRNWTINWNRLIDPRTGTVHQPYTLTTFGVTVTCMEVLGSYDATVSSIVQIEDAIVPLFYPYEQVGALWGEG